MDASFEHVSITSETAKIRPIAMYLGDTVSCGDGGKRWI